MITNPFKYCPFCGTASPAFSQDKVLQCGSCKGVYFHNTASSAGVFLVSDNGLLLLERAVEPGKGLYGLPGGFVDPGESLEEAVHREVREETGLEVSALRYLCSLPNVYRYKGVQYTTCDVFFTGRVKDFASIQTDPGEVVRPVFVDVDSINPEVLAFPSIQQAFAVFKKERTPPPERRRSLSDEGGM